MKLTKSQLKQIIHEELQGLMQEDEDDIALTARVENSLVNFWKHLNDLLKGWRHAETDEGRAYHNQLKTVMTHFTKGGPDEPSLDEKKDDDWIQKAVDPKHKGYCTPMTKKTCTPARKALAKRFKKAAKKEEEEGGTGWQGKV